jgi:hypothetical protein
MEDLNNAVCLSVLLIAALAYLAVRLVQHAVQRRR